MGTSRELHAAAHHKDLGFLITGGKHPESYKTSTEITRDGVTFEAFTPLPIGLRSHCMVALDGDEEGDFFVGGGHSSGQQYDKRAYIYKINQWVEVEELPTGRVAFMCGPVRASPGGSIEKIVAAGGWTAGGRLDNIDIYDINSDTWVTGNSLPYALSSATTL